HEKPTPEGPGGSQVPMEFFYPANTVAAPAVVLLHGADGLAGRAGDYHDACRDLARAGFFVALPHYLAVGPNPAGRAWPINPLKCFQWLSAVQASVGRAAGHPRAAGGRVGLVGYSLG